MKKLFQIVLLTLFVTVLFSSCRKQKSSMTGWNYNDTKQGGFEVTDYQGQATGPNLVLVQGGTFTMGNVEQDVAYDYHSIPRRVTVSSFYIDETEVANVHYREYLYWLGRTFKADFPEIYRRAFPDSMVWREELAFNDPYVQYYFRHPSYDFYPVVGVNWLQANEFCKWRSNRVNEILLADKKYMELNVNAVNGDNFDTEAYLLGQYETGILKGPKDYSPDAVDAKTGRRVKMEDGLLLPDYRLPTEAEWEFAALGLIGNHIEEEEMITDRRIYPWNTTSMRYPNTKQKWQSGEMLANFKRGRGDYAGIPGKLNDNAIVTAPVYSYLPNDNGLYNMAGNVNEWVADVYRDYTYLDMEDLNPYRGNNFQTRMLDEEGNVAEKSDTTGRIRYRSVADEELVDRRNYKRADLRNHVDGDSLSEVTYQYGQSTLVNNNARVYKGGSWADEAYWLAPGSRRYLEEDQASATIGFRCAQIRLGGDVNNDVKGGNHFKKGDTQKKMNDKARKKSQI